MDQFNFEKLEVYKKALSFTDKIYLLTKDFPADEKFNLTSQLKRAAISIAVNIAEGSASTKKDFNRFLTIASGSVKEIVVCITIAQRQSLISQKIEIEIRDDLVEISKMISGLKKYLNKQK